MCHYMFDYHNKLFVNIFLYLKYTKTIEKENLVKNIIYFFFFFINI